MKINTAVIISFFIKKSCKILIGAVCLVLPLLMGGGAYAQSVISPAPQVQSRTTTSPTRPAIDSRFLGLENRRLQLKKNDYETITALAQDYLNCPLPAAFQDPPKLSSRYVTTGRSLLRYAAERGFAKAQMALGLHYAYTRCGVTAVPVEAFAWQKAAYTNDPNLFPDFTIEGARVIVPSAQWGMADELASNYIEKYVRPYGAVALIRKPIPCPFGATEATMQATYLPGTINDLARQSVIDFRGRPFANVNVAETSPQGCKRTVQLGRFHVRPHQSLEVSSVNDALYRFKACIYEMKTTTLSSVSDGSFFISIYEGVTSLETQQKKYTEMMKSGIFDLIEPQYVEGDQCD